MMANIELKLENKLYCDGCPCLVEQSQSLRSFCNYYGIARDFSFKTRAYERFEKCIENNGE